MKNSPFASWTPTRPPSRGATAYHDAVVNTSWHKENINHLIEIVRTRVRENDRVVDFGAGTGASGVYLLQNIPITFKLILVDNSPSWLGKAYEILHQNNTVTFSLLEKADNFGYMTLDKVIGKNSVHHVISANTVHLIPDILQTFQGIYDSLKTGGTFTFQSGNILKKKIQTGIMMIDDSIDTIHDLALEVIRTQKKFKKYAQNLSKRIREEKNQRKFVFPSPRPLEFYLKHLKTAGFKNESITYKRIRVKYQDWLNFVRVRRLQAGILPEMGGKDASPEEEIDRDIVITQAAKQLFQHLKMHNPLATTHSFYAEWVYVQAEK